MADGVRLPTVTGAVTISTPDERRECSACGATGGGIADVDVERSDRDTSTFPICGSCVLEGLAIMFGRRHVQRGGDVEDLTVEPAACDHVYIETGDRPVCGSCGAPAPD